MSRKLLKRAVVGIMAAAMIMTVTGGVAPKTASATTVKKSGDFKYVKYANGVKITKYTGKAKKVTIPAKIAGKKVVAIGENAFYQNKKIKQIKISDNVKKIDDCAFASCSKLKKVTMPKKLEKCGSAAFAGTAVKNITIPEGVKIIEDNAFRGCENLQTVTLSDDVKIIESGAFENCEKLTTINLDIIEEIGWESFKNNTSLAGNLTLKNVTVIENDAFYGCTSIKSVEFSDSLQKLGKRETDPSEAAMGASALPQDVISGMDSSNPFEKCSNIEQFSIDVNNANFSSVDGVIYGKTGQWLVAYPAKKQGDVILSDNVKGIGDYAFAGTNIGKITMGKGLNSIGKMAFAKSTVTEVNMSLPDETKVISWKADAFYDCASLKKVVFPEGIKSSNGIAFYNCKALTEVVLPKTIETLSNAMFMGCTSLQTVVLPETVKRIPDQCFYKCSALSNINLENVEYVGGMSFEECKSLTGVLNLNITSYDYGAFAECTGITEVNLNKPITAFPEINLNLMRFVEPISKISEYEGTIIMQATQDYDSNPHSNSGNPFAGCTNLTKINTTSEGLVKSVDGALFSSDMKNLISFPAGITGKYNIPYGVEKVADNAFSGANISEVVCSNSVVEIGNGAFYNSKVKSVTISKSVAKMDGRSAFSGCSELEKIEVHVSNDKFESVDGMLCQKAGKIKNLLVYPAAKKGKILKLAKNIEPEYGAFTGCKYLKKVYFNKLTDKYSGGRFIMFYNCSNIKIYLPKDFVLFDKYDLKLKDSDGYYSYGFDHQDLMVKATCKGCKTYVKKGSKLAKKLDKKKVKYRSY